MSDARWMGRCLELARRARSQGEAAVGCVVVRDGAVLGESGERVRAPMDPAGHAEILALQAACRSLGSLDLAGSTLYTNVEPCFMCSHAIRECGIAKVVILQPFEGMGGVTSIHPILTDDRLPYRWPPPRCAWATDPPDPDDPPPPSA